jgi:hypothetical protein
MLNNPKEDAVYALQPVHEGVPRLVKLNPDGAVLNKTQIEGPIIPGSLPEGHGMSGIQLVHANGWLVLLASPGGHHVPEDGSPQKRKYIYLIDPKTGKAQLTWKDPPGAAKETGFVFEQTFALKAGEVRTFPIETPREDQRLTLVIRSKGASVDAFLLPRDEAKKAADALATGKPVVGFTAAAQGAEEEVSFTVAHNVGKEFSLVVGNARKATVVSLTMTSR